MKLTGYLFTLSTLLIAMLGSCRNAKSSSENVEGDTVTSRAQLLTLVDGPNYTLATVKNPWDTTSILGRYILVSKDFPSDSLALLPQGTRITIPLKASLVYSGVHGGAVAELGAIDAIAAVTEGNYFTNRLIIQALGEHKIADVGSSMSPSVERIAEIGPDAILTSPYQNSGHGAIEALGIPIIDMADYMEPTPLGRAEWIKLLGRLYGHGHEADSIYNSVCAAYESLAQKTAGAQTKPMVITEQPVNGVWAMPGGNSYMSRMLKDAGANYPWAGDNSTGSLELAPATVLEKAEETDFWLIRSYGPLGLDDLAANVPVADCFRAFHQGGVYISDTSTSPLFDEFPFHPELLLREYILMFHPECITDGGGLRYFKAAR